METTETTSFAWREKWDSEGPPPPAVGDPDEDVSAPSLLYVARHVWICMKSTYGGPGEVARWGPVLKKGWNKVMFWLADIERLTRSILFIMAFAIAPKPGRPSESAPGSSPKRAKSGELASTRQAAPDPEDYANPDTWRVSFRILRTPQDAPGVRPVASAEPSRFGMLHEAKAIARRFEALLRVLNDPEPFAHRLALRLSRMAQAPHLGPQPKPPAKPFVYRRHYIEPIPNWTHPGPCALAVRRAERRRDELAGGYWAPG